MGQKRAEEKPQSDKAFRGILAGVEVIDGGECEPLNLGRVLGDLDREADFALATATAILEAMIGPEPCGPDSPSPQGLIYRAENTLESIRRLNGILGQLLTVTALPKGDDCNDGNCEAFKMPQKPQFVYPPEPKKRGGRRRKVEEQDG